MSINPKVTAAAVWVASASAALGAESTPCAQDYKIRHGDTLLEIAQEQLGTVFAVQHIINVNRTVIGHNPDLIYAGDVLAIPCETVTHVPLDWTVVPDVNTLHALVRDDAVQVLDIRSHDAVNNGFVPGAVHVPYLVWAQAAALTSKDAAEIEMSDIIGLSGLRLDQPIIIINTKPSALDLDQAAEVYRVLETIGSKHLAILRDGYRGWIAENLPVAASATLRDPYDVHVTYLPNQRAQAFDIFARVAEALLDV